MLVETSNQKIPPTSMLGSSEDVLSKATAGNGHVSRNIRVSLLSLDLVEPYVSIVAVNDLALSDDVVPLVERNCKNAMKQVMIPQNVDRISVEWSVGGCLNIDETSLWVANSIQDGSLDCLSQPSRADIEASFTQVSPSGAAGGHGYFSENGPIPDASVSNVEVEPSLGPIFSAVVDVSALGAGQRLTLIASARVDRAWSEKPTSNVKPDVPPQAHVVNARTNPDWFFESSGKRVKGRLDWFSIPIVIVVGEYRDNVGQDQAGRQITTVEISNRFGHTTGPGGAAPFRASNSSSPNPIIFFVAILFAFVLAALLFIAARRRQRAWRQFDEMSDEDWANEPYSDLEMKAYDDEPQSTNNNLSMLRTASD